VNFRNEERAPLLFIAGGEDNLMPPAVNQSNVKHYRHVNTVTDYKEFPGRSHYTVEAVMNSNRNGLGIGKTEIAKEPSRPRNPHFYAVFAQVHNTL
jgi:hypothetical protein